MPRRHLRGSGEVSRGRARSPHADEMARLIGPRCQVGHPVSRRETGRWESPFDLGQGILAAPQQNAPSQASPSPRHSHVPPKLNVHEHVALQNAQASPLVKAVAALAEISGALGSGGATRA